jgi:hypothetical protein
MNTIITFLYDLEALGVIGLQEVFNPRNSLVVEDCIKNGIKVWMLQKDPEEFCMINCNALRLL